MVVLNDSAQLPSRTEPGTRPTTLALLRAYLPQGNLLDDAAWRRRHVLLRWLLLLHAPGILLFGLWRGFALTSCLYVCAPILGCLLLGTLAQRRRLASFFITAGLVYCSSALVGLSGGMIEAHFHFFIIIGFIALYQDWVPFLWNILFTVFSHGLGSAWSGTLIFNHPAAQGNPWLWSLVHGVAVLAACVGMVIFWRYSEDEMQKSITLRTRIAESEVERRRFTSDLLVNLARRNQSMLHLQLGIINQLEQAERDPDALADLFRLDHLATRIRRNAESLLVLSGEEPPRVWSQPVRLRDVIRAAIAETEDLDRVDFEIGDDPAVHGRLVTGLTHLLAELVENAVRFSAPQTRVTLRVRPDHRSPGTQVITVEDLGLGMPAEDLARANQILADPPDVDLSTSQRYGLHVVSRLAQRLSIEARLTPGPSGGVTAVVVLPVSLFVAQSTRGEDRVRPAADRPAPSTGRLAWAEVGLGTATPPPSGQVYEPSLSDPAPAAPAPAVPSFSAPERRPAAPAVTFGVQVSDDGWGGWWQGASQDQLDSRPDPLFDPRPDSRPDPLFDPRPDPQPRPVLPAVVQPTSVDLREGALSQRTPQAHLAPELRRSGPAPEPAPVANAITAREALSQYQSRREAALNATERRQSPSWAPGPGDSEEMRDDGESGRVP